jgi:hypothetical protein
MKWIVLTGMVMLSFFESGCYYDKEEELYPNGNCDTAHVTYTTVIASLINNYGCLGCHYGPAPSGGFSLQGYQNVKAKVTDGRLYGAISHAAGFSPMPQGAINMSSCDINKVKAWIDAGAPEN